MHNHAREGGAVYDYDRGAPQFIDCRFVENGALYGGAIVDRVGVRSTITNCEFVGNNAVWRAGAVYLDYGARPVITDCRFQGNRSQCHGGAIATISRASQLENTIAVLVRCSFIENTAGHRGGAIANNDQSVLGLDGCTFTANTAASGGALANNYRAQAVLLDCHFSKNTAAKEKETDTATDDTSRVSRARADWPSQTVAPSPALPRGFGPPGR
jgi:predicted outer membrane repeat protein